MGAMLERKTVTKMASKRVHRKEHQRENQLVQHSDKQWGHSMDQRWEIHWADPWEFLMVQLSGAASDHQTVGNWDSLWAQRRDKM